jgi:hypothetical protein
MLEASRAASAKIEVVATEALASVRHVLPDLRVEWVGSSRWGLAAPWSDVDLMAGCEPDGFCEASDALERAGHRRVSLTGRGAVHVLEIRGTVVQTNVRSPRHLEHLFREGERMARLPRETLDRMVLERWHARAAGCREWRRVKYGQLVELNVIPPGGYVP